MDAKTALDQLGAKWSPAFDRPRPLHFTARDCVICNVVRPEQDCNCHEIEFGSDEYFARLDRVHGRR